MAYYASLESKFSQAARWMSDLQSSQDIDIYHCVRESMIIKGMHLSLVCLAWDLPSKEKESLNK
jgi:hypothetical protein